MRQAFEIPATVHGHYVVESPARESEPLPLLVGFHGYAETAEVHLSALRRIPGIDGWRRCAVQGLHSFYRGKTGDVVASWMTRFGRERAIEDNVRYVSEVVARIKADFATREPLVYVGFSQGTAMAYRAAAGAGHPSQALLALGGDVPPELSERDLAGFPRVLIGRGGGDPWYSEEKLAADVKLLKGKGVSVEVCAFDGGHEWSEPFYQAAGDLLRSLGSGPRPVPV
jgi:predicted esterase